MKILACAEQVCFGSGQGGKPEHLRPIIQLLPHSQHVSSCKTNFKPDPVHAHERAGLARDCDLLAFHGQSVSAGACKSTVENDG